MKQTTLIILALLLAPCLKAQLYINGQKIPDYTLYINVIVTSNNVVRVDYGQENVNRKSIITDDKRTAFQLSSPIHLLSYLDLKGWKPAVLGKELNDFAFGIQQRLLFIRKK